MLLLDYAVVEQIQFNETGYMRALKLSQFHYSLLQAQHSLGMTFAFLNENDIAQVFTKCRHLVLLTSLYCFIFGVGWLYRCRVALTYLLIAIETLCLLKSLYNFWIWLNTEINQPTEAAIESSNVNSKKEKKE